MTATSGPEEAEPFVASGVAADVEVGLRSSKTRTFAAAVEQAVGLGREGDALLAGLQDLRGWKALYVTAVLGDVEGPSGGAVLRRTIASHGAGTSDLRCAALLALAKRERAGASEELSVAVGDADAAVREYAVMGLAAVGDGRSWNEVCARLKAMLSRQRSRTGEPSAVVCAVVYLLRHVGEDTGRATAVVSLLRLWWNRLFAGEKRWFVERWPAVEPRPDAVEEPGLPDPAALQRWLLADPLFSEPALLSGLGDVP